MSRVNGSGNSQRVWQLADSICVSPPTYALTPEKLQYYSDMIAATFAPDSL